MKQIKVHLFFTPAMSRFEVSYTDFYSDRLWFRKQTHFLKCTYLSEKKGESNVSNVNVIDTMTNLSARKTDDRRTLRYYLIVKNVYCLDNHRRTNTMATLMIYLK